MSLGWYLQDAQQLSHDASFLFTSKPVMTRWINLGRRELARRTGCVRRLIVGQSAFGASAQPGSFVPGGAQPGALPGANPGASFGATTNSFMTITGQERYPYVGFLNPALTSQYAGVTGVTDTIEISISWGGSQRPTLDWVEWDVLQARARSFQVLVTSFPFWWSVYNDGEFGEIWLYPVPNQPMEIEADVFAVPADLNSDNDFDVIPPGFRSAVKWYAAGMAAMGRQRFSDARVLFDMFADSIGSSRFAADSGKSRTMYPAMFGR